ncbi:TrgA family protein [Leisingera sp. ANG-M7]|uniref:TrgA family protein n=1 Tax=Leisingera sp. ANG-M7 TaxID=1577902 RepID=UPI0005808186|nr:TrgA family protein [Leisingera sp. ANG-M7]KIC39168.1 tellurium resistance protein [Leisingera sp. ANG-M7]
MPTGARLAAAISLATLAFVVSFLVMPLLPVGTNFGYFVHINVVLGLLCGWIFMGKRAGRGVVPAINNGLTGMAVLVLWALFVQGAWEMFRLAMRHRYGGPFEALSQIFVIGMEYFFLIAVPSVVIPLVVGGALAGLVTENASQRWR